MELKFHINHQNLKRVDKQTIARLSQEYLTCNFKFITPDWEGITKYVIFSNEEINNEIELGIDMNCTCKVPNQMLRCKKFKITVYGVDGESRITTTQRSIATVKSGYTEEILPIENDDIESDVFSRINTEIDNLNSTLNTKADTVHVHEISDVNNLSSTLDSKADTNHNHSINDVTDFEQGVELDVKNALTSISRKIRTYGGE